MQQTKKLAWALRTAEAIFQETDESRHHAFPLEV